MVTRSVVGFSLGFMFVAIKPKHALFSGLLETRRRTESVPGLKYFWQHAVLLVMCLLSL